MKLVIIIGPDMFGTKRYSSKASAKRAIRKIAGPKQKGQNGNLSRKFLGRPFCKSEVEGALVLTVDEFFNEHLLKN